MGPGQRGGGLHIQMFRFAVEVGSGYGRQFSENARSAHADYAKGKAFTVFAASAEFTDTATEARIDQDFVADMESVHIRRGINNDSRRIRTQYMRKRVFEAGAAFAHPDIKVVQRRRLNFHKHFTR